MTLLLKLLGFKEELPLNYTPGDPAQRRVSDDLERQRDLIARNDRNTAHYLGHDVAVQRYRLRLRIHEALGKSRGVMPGAA